MTTQMEAMPIPWQIRIAIKAGKTPKKRLGGIEIVAIELSSPQAANITLMEGLLMHIDVYVPNTKTRCDQSDGKCAKKLANCNGRKEPSLLLQCEHWNNSAVAVYRIHTDDREVEGK